MLGDCRLANRDDLGNFAYSTRSLCYFFYNCPAGRIGLQQGGAPPIRCG